MTEASSAEGKKYRCRKLEEADLERVMGWRMLPHVTCFMSTDPVLTPEKQMEWFQRLTASGNLYYWIIEVDSLPCGLINLTDVDYVNKRCGWGYYVAEKKARSFHLAMSLEMSLYDYVFEKMELNKIVSDAFCVNTSVVKIHQLCGCETEGILKKHIFKNGRFYDVVLQSMFAETWLETRSRFEYQRVKFED